MMPPSPSQIEMYPVHWLMTKRDSRRFMTSLSMMGRIAIFTVCRIYPRLQAVSTAV